MSSFSDSIWDEHRWEQHLNSLQVGLVKKKTFMKNSWGENEPVWMRFLKEYDDVEEALESYLDEELTYEDAYFPEDPDEIEDDDDFDDEIVGKKFLFDDPEAEFSASNADSDDEFFIPDPAEIDMNMIQLTQNFDDAGDLFDDDFDELEGEEWKSSIEDAFLNPFNESEDPFFCFIHYDEIHELSLYFLLRTRIYTESQDNQQFVDFMAELLLATTKYAGGLAFDIEDLSTMGAIITYFKHSLTHLNNAMDKLGQLKNEELITQSEYDVLFTRFFELRNNMGIMIQEMREFLEKYIS